MGRDTQHGVGHRAERLRARLAPILGAATRTVGIARDLAIAAVFRRDETDSFFVAFTIPSALRLLLADAMTSRGLAPIVSRTLRKEGEDAARILYARLRGVMGGLLVLVTAAGIALAQPFTELLAVGYRRRYGEFERTLWLSMTLFPYLLFAGLAAHSFLSLDEPLSAAFGVLLGAAAHAVGWPIPRGGAQSLTNALCGCLAALGGTLMTSARVDSLASLPVFDVTLCDVTPRQLVRMAGSRLSATYRTRLGKYRYGPAAFKVDYALREPIPWRAAECFRAATVHLGGRADEIAASEASMRHGHHSERPFVLVVQPSLFDPTRAPTGRHTAWAYCHVPNGYAFDMLGIIEAQIERFAPGFRDCILGRRVFSPAALEKMDANLIGGDISGGAMDIRQTLFRPTRSHYATSARDIYLCSSSTPPGGGVHGMCGYHAAQVAMSRLGL